MSSHEKWLRQAAEVLTDRNMTAIANTCVQAADAIAWLQAEVERLNKSLDVAAACATDKNRQFAEMQRRIDHLESWQESVLRESDPACEYTADQLGSDCVVTYDDHKRHCAHLAAKLVDAQSCERSMVEALKEAIDLRVKLYRHSDMEGDTDSWSDDKIIASDSYARKWKAALPMPPAPTSGEQGPCPVCKCAWTANEPVACPVCQDKSDAKK